MSHNSTPLSAYLDGPTAQTRQKRISKNPRKMWIGALLLALLPSLGTTFASSISINSDTAIEFGQGTQSTEVCDDAINIAIGTEWSSANSFFRATAITLSDLNTTSGNCFEKTLTVKALDSNGTEIDLNGAGTTGNALTLSVTTAGSATATEVLTISGDVNSVDLARVTIETA